jgi:hypothetical protein
MGPVGESEAGSNYRSWPMCKVLTAIVTSATRLKLCETWGSSASERQGGHQEVCYRRVPA